MTFGETPFNSPHLSSISASKGEAEKCRPQTPWEVDIRHPTACSPCLHWPPVPPNPPWPTGVSTRPWFCSHIPPPVQQAAQLPAPTSAPSQAASLFSQAQWFHRNIPANPFLFWSRLLEPPVHAVPLKTASRPYICPRLCELGQRRAEAREWRGWSMEAGSMLLPVWHCSLLLCLTVFFSVTQAQEQLPRAYASLNLQAAFAENAMPRLISCWLKFHYNSIHCAVKLGITQLPQLKNFTHKGLIYNFSRVLWH